MVNDPQKAIVWLLTWAVTIIVVIIIIIECCEGKKHIFLRGINLVDVLIWSFFNIF